MQSQEHATQMKIRDNRTRYKYKHAGRLAKKLTFGSLGLFCLEISLICFATVLLSLGKHNFITLASACGSITSAYIGIRILRKTEHINPDILASHASTAELPTSESLVRPAEESVQQQGTFLLRSTSSCQEQHEKQFIRTELEPRE